MQLRVQLSSRVTRIVRSAGSVALVGGVALATTFGGTAKPMQHSASKAPEQSRYITAAGIRFTLPKDWIRMTDDQLPDSAETGSKAHVVAGACVDRSGTGACGLDVTYLLAGEDSEMPGLATLQEYLTQQLPGQLKGVKVLSSAFDRTNEGTRMLQHEISFIRNGEQWNELVTAFRLDAEGVIVIAAGPEAEYQKHRDGLLSKLRQARVLPDGDTTGTP